MTFGEDSSRARTRNRARGMASLRNPAITISRPAGHASIAAALRMTDRPAAYSRDTDDPSDRRFSGYFRFAADDELTAPTEDGQLGNRLVAEVSRLIYAAPLPKRPVHDRTTKFCRRL